jgi:hypothetical protein
MHSGAARSCDGPRPWQFYEEFGWTGCPRRSLDDPRVLRWLDVYRRTDGGKLSLTEAAATTPLLLDVLRVIDRVQGLRSAAEVAEAKRQFQPAGSAPGTR